MLSVGTISSVAISECGGGKIGENALVAGSRIAASGKW